MKLGTDLRIYNLREVVIPGDLKSVGSQAFYVYLEEVNLPNSVSLLIEAFASCDN